MRATPSVPRFTLAATLALALTSSKPAVVRSAPEPELTFVSPRPAPAPPPLGARPAAAPTPKVERRVVHRASEAIVQPRAAPVQPPDAPVEPPAPAPAQPSAPPDAVPGAGEGDPRGSPGAQGDGAPGSTGTFPGPGAGAGPGEVVTFGEGMTRPVMDPANTPVRYTREALEAKVQGLMLLKCVITLEGALTRCRVVKGLPHMDQAVLDTVSSWRVTPVTFQGRPVVVEYVIPVRLVIPK